MPYKILSERNGKLFSMIVDGKAEVRYKINKWVQAPKWLAKKGYHLTYFNKLKDALFFKNRSPFDVLYHCKVQDEINKLPKMASFLSLYDGKLHPFLSQEWLRSTKMAKKIMITRKVKTKEGFNVA